MEMVSTAKSKKASDRVNASQPYAKKIQELISSLSSLASVVDSPYLRIAENEKSVGLLVITANRGLCGGYNTNTVKLAKARIKELTNQGKTCKIYVAGKKGISAFRFSGIETVESFTNIDDKSGFKEAEIFADIFMGEFAKENIDRVEIISTVYHSAGNQKPEVKKVLPFEPEKGGKTSSDNVIYEPNPAQILHSLLPLVVKSAFQKAILEAVCSEHIARRVAMKSATDAATEMGKMLTRSYNRIRQAKITQEISEIVAGADSIS